MKTGKQILDEYNSQPFGDLDNKKFVTLEEMIDNALKENSFTGELKPCPFCGGEASVGTTKYSDKMVRQQKWKQNIFYHVNCIICGADNSGLVGHQTEIGAIQKWNRRA